MDTQSINSSAFKLTDLEVMINDINTREQYLSSFFNMWEQRVKLQYEYAEKIRSIYLGNPCQNKAQTIKNWHNNLMMKCTKSQKRRSVHFRQTTAGISPLVILLQFSAKSLKKQLQTQLDQLQKSKQKCHKKSSQLQKLKLDYINATVLQDRDFEKKNKLFLKIKELQSEIIPIKKNYESSALRYGDTLSTTLTKFNEVCKRVEEKQFSMVNYMKRCLIDSQLFFSAFGAIVVHETQVILRDLDSIQIIQGTEVTSRTSIEMQEERSSYENSFSNNFQYLQQTFKKIQNNSIQEIILYGKNPEYKRELSHYFENSETFENFKNLKVINCYTVRIVEIFKAVFEGKEYSASSFIEFRELIRGKPTLRKDFIFCLQKYRLDGKFNIKKQLLPHIIELLNIFLDVCANQFDTYNSKQFMVLSFTYYFINEEGEKIDLQYCVKSHKIWRNIKWWESSLIESIYQEHKVKKRKPEGTLNPIFSLWDIKTSSVKKIDSNSEQASIVHNICFNQLAYYLHNMHLFDIPWNDVNGLAQKYIKVFGLNSKMTADLQTLCLGLNKQAQSPKKSQQS